MTPQRLDYTHVSELSETLLSEVSHQSMSEGMLLIGLRSVAGLLSTATAPTVMKINVSIAKDSHQGIGIDTFAKEVEARTKGRYRVETLYAGSLGGEREWIESMYRAHTPWPRPPPVLRLTLYLRCDSFAFLSSSATKRLVAPCSMARSVRT
jgi:hypothetical protein